MSLRNLERVRGLSGRPSRRASPGTPGARALVVVTALLAAMLGACTVSRASVWIDNQSSQQAVVFVDDLGSGPAPWYVVPAKTTVHVGSAGLGSSAVRVNLLGWRHEENHVSRCAPGDYDDTLYDVPPGASVRLLIEESGQPSVSLASEPPNLPTLDQTHFADQSEAGICAATSQP